MKLLAYKLYSYEQELFEVPPASARKVAEDAFGNGYDRILSQWKDKLIILEKISNTTNIDESIKYTKTEIKYHPLQHKVQ